MASEPGSITSFLVKEYKNLDYPIFQLNLYLGAYNDEQKPYKIEYNTLLTSYHGWRGKDLDEFCLNQTLGHFLSNPKTTKESPGAREAFCLEIREFLLGA